jgi:hypothetical protein
MCVCNCTHDEFNTLLVPGTLSKRGLFNWVTILLLTGWILIVAVAANNAQVEVRSEAATIQAFIEKQL